MPPRGSTDHRVFVALRYHETKNAAEVVKRFERQFSDVSLSADVTVKAIYDKLMATGSVLDQHKGHAGRPAISIKDANIRAVDALSKTTNNPQMCH